jgi:hypothetical protein
MYDMRQTEYGRRRNTCQQCYEIGLIINYFIIYCNYVLL